MAALIVSLIGPLIGAFRQRSRGEVRRDHHRNDCDIFAESARNDAAKLGEALWQLRHKIAAPSRLEDPNAIARFQSVAMHRFSNAPARPSGLKYQKKRGAIKCPLQLNGPKFVRDQVKKKPSSVLQ